MEFWISRDHSPAWSVCCVVKGHTICLLRPDGVMMRFDTPESCIALFSGRADISEQWTDWLKRIRSVGDSHTYAIPNFLSEEQRWLPSADLPG